MTTAREWEVFDDERHLLGTTYGSQRVRMLTLGLRGGGLLVVSPGAGIEERRMIELERRGRPRFLLAPNHFHNEGLSAWRARYPDARLCAHPRAHARLRKKVLGASFEGLDALSEALPEGARVFGPPMAKQGEVLVSTPTKEGTAWFVTDALLNEARLPGGPLGLLLRLLGFRPGLLTNPFFKRMFLESKAAYKEWMRAELSRDPPQVFIPSHGEVLRGPDAAAKLLAATDAA